ncbi:MAG: hypothetical protein ABIT37_22805 [Luteolibacter sp.]
MKASTVPILCGTALAAMSAAGASHWWSVRQFTTAFHAGIPMVQPKVSPPVMPPAVKPAAAPTVLAVSQSKDKTPVTVAGPQKEFFEALLAEVKNLRTQNLNLVDQMAETNRDLMKLEFRVDTHSESFRPLPTSEDRPDTTLDTTSLDDGPGVLPPRAQPVFPVSGE